MASSEYWAKREAEQLKHNVTDEKEYDRQIRRIYSDMLDACQKEINSFYGRYADKEGITLAEAKKRVSQLDIKEYERKAKRYVKDKDFSKKANEEMRLYNATMKINRLEMLKANIGLELISGHDELEKFMAGVLQGRTEDELKRQAGILGKSVKNNAQKAHAIVNASFHNATFSDRIWMYQDLMKADMSKLLQSGMIQGKNPRALAKELKKYFIGDEKKVGGAAFNVERLMRTELARVQTEAQKQSFIRNGFEEYEFIVNSGCCDICAGLNGKHFKVSKMMPGENAPPMHPHCRCSTAAYEDSKDYEAWLDYLDKGGTTAEWDKMKEKGLTNNSNSKYNELQKLRYSGLVSEELEKSFEETLSKMPESHRKLAESKISEIEITDSELGSSYNRKTGKIKLSKNASANEIIHEYAHALEEALNSYNDPNFKNIMAKGLESTNVNDIIWDDTTFVEPIYRIENKKFVSVYQGRLYEEYGIFDGTNVLLDGMRDYLSEGYAEYILNPDNLKRHDPDLYNYFGSI